jgi:hypothetical protein
MSLTYSRYATARRATRHPLRMPISRRCAAQHHRLRQGLLPPRSRHAADRDARLLLGAHRQQQEFHAAELVGHLRHRAQHRRHLASRHERSGFQHPQPVGRAMYMEEESPQAVRGGAGVPGRDGQVVATSSRSVPLGNSERRAARNRWLRTQKARSWGLHNLARPGPTTGVGHIL